MYAATGDVEVLGRSGPGPEGDTEIQGEGAAHEKITECLQIHRGRSYSSSTPNSMSSAAIFLA